MYLINQLCNLLMPAEWMLTQALSVRLCCKSQSETPWLSLRASSSMFSWFYCPGITEGLHTGLTFWCSVGVFRRHPPEDMEDLVPRLSSVAAEIETPGQSPRSGVTSPSAGILQSGDSFTRAFMHQARRLRTAVLHQTASAPPLMFQHAQHVLLLTEEGATSCWTVSCAEHPAARPGIRAAREPARLCRQSAEGGAGIWMPSCALQVNFSDVAHNPSLARAARAELDGRPPAHSAFTQSSDLQAGRPHDAEVSSTLPAYNRQLHQLTCA